MKTAAELREISNNTAGFEEALAVVDSVTMKAAARHETTITVQTRLLPITSVLGVQKFCELLRSDYGLAVEYHCDQRDGDYIRITW